MGLSCSKAFFAACTRHSWATQLFSWLSASSSLRVISMSSAISASLAVYVGSAESIGCLLLVWFIVITAST